MEGNRINPKVYKVKKSSIDKALNILKSTKMKSKELDEYKREDSMDHKIKLACTSSIKDQRFTQYGSIFFKDIFLSKLYSCLCNQDWENLMHLYKMFLSYGYLYKEQIVWRYAVLIMLHYSGRSATDIEEFLRTCVEGHLNTDTKIESMLEEMLTFPNVENDKQNSQTLEETRRFLRAKRTIS